MWHLGIRKDPTLVLLVGIFVLLSIMAVLLIVRGEVPSRCDDPYYNPALITHEQVL